ncbi:hypothetical protein NP493_646g01105 [Ridgeia piscesae]|uniref:Mitochondrial carrier protein n=1 Tax=Ridgeia piscesae TaxID=27915 RepID=A0AAD9KTN8_RIDPI|nr:hypothetical protein NP493_646g01105 [Ridgeia piscesae]
MRCIIRENGVRGPFKGLALTVARDASSFGIYMLSFQYICDCLTPDYEVNKPTAGVVLFAGGMAGCISWYNMPVDIVKSRIQADSVRNPRYRGWCSCAKELYREGGWKAFYRGFSVTLVRTFPLNAVTFFVYQKSLTVLKRLLHVDTL